MTPDERLRARKEEVVRKVFHWLFTAEDINLVMSSAQREAILSQLGALFDAGRGAAQGSPAAHNDSGACALNYETEEDGRIIATLTFYAYGNTREQAKQSVYRLSARLGAAHPLIESQRAYASGYTDGRNDERRGVPMSGAAHPENEKP